MRVLLESNLHTLTTELCNHQEQYVHKESWAGGGETPVIFFHHLFSSCLLGNVTNGNQNGHRVRVRTQKWIQRMDFLVLYPAGNL